MSLVHLDCLGTLGILANANFNFYKKDAETKVPRAETTKARHK